MSGLASSLASTELRVAALLLLSIALAHGVGRRQARTRAHVLAVGLVLALALPLLLRVLPPMDLPSTAPVPPAELALAPVAWAGTPPPARSPLLPAGDAAATRAAMGMAWPALLLATWALGTIVLLARLAAGLVVARRLRRRAVPCELGVDVLASDEVTVPITVGILRPVVILPEEALHWDASRLRTALAHERAHVAAHDNLAQLAATLVVAAHWWNPMAWIAARALRSARESAADDAAVAVAAHPADVAAHLVASARDAAGSRAFALGMHDGGDLESRVRRLVAPGFHAGGLSRRRTAVGMFGLAIVALPLVSPHDRATTASTSEAVPTDAASPVDVVTPAPVVTTPTGVAPVSAIAPAASLLERAVAAGHAGLRSKCRGSAIVALDLRERQAHQVHVHSTPEDAAHAPEAAERPIVMGSVIKPLTVAIALDAGVVTPETVLDCGSAPLEVGGGTIRDVEWLGECTVTDVVTRSSNVGTARIVERLTSQQLREGFARFGLASGLPAGEWTDLERARVGIGLAPRLTPQALTQAYELLVTGRAVKPETSRAVLAMLEAAVERGTGKPAAITGVRVAGKTGTAKIDGGGTQASFVGILPADEPRWIVLVTVDTAEPGYSGGAIAAPAFRAAARLLLDEGR